jgi:recombination protein RecA
MAAKSKRERFCRADLLQLSSLETVSHIPFDVAPLDFFTRGGVPEGTFSLFTGRKSSGKTTAAIMALRGFQRKYPDKLALYVNAENKIAPSWAKQLGVDLDRVSVFYPGFGEEAHALIKEAMREWPEYGLIIVDSLAALTPNAEVESNPATDQFMAPAARGNNRFFREAVSLQCQLATQGRRVTILVINQERTSTKIQYGDPTVIPGGVGQEFHAALWIRFLASEYTIDKKLSIPLTTTIKFTIQKNIDAPPRMSGEFDMHVVQMGRWKPGDVDDMHFVWLWGLRCGAIVRSGRNWTYLGSEPRSQKEMFELWKEDPNHYRAVKQAVFEAFWRALDETGSTFDDELQGEASAALAENGAAVSLNL